MLYFRNRYLYRIVYWMSMSTQTFIVYLCVLSKQWLSMWDQTTKSVYTLFRDGHMWTNSSVIPTSTLIQDGENVNKKCLNCLCLMFSCPTAQYQVIQNTIETVDAHSNFNIGINLVLLCSDFSMVSFSIMSAPSSLFKERVISQFD